MSELETVGMPGGPVMKAAYFVVWVLIRIAFMGYQLFLAFYDIFINGFRHELRLGGKGDM